MRAVPYVPFYLALAGGYWKSEGLDIRHVVSPSTSRTATALLEGSVDVSWGGPMRVIVHHDGDPAYPPFYAPRRFTRARREACRRLVRGMARAQAALFAATPAAIADAVATFLPKLSRAALTRIVAAYRTSGLWAKTPELPPTPYLRLKAALVSGGLIRSDPPYERLVDAELSQMGS